MKRFGSRVCHGFLVAFLIWVDAHAAPEIKPEMRVQLPPYIVETAIGPTWRYTEIPRFEILSRCNDLTTEQLALTFHRANQLLNMVLPERFQLALDVPRALIFYDESLWPVAEQKAVSAMLRVNPPARPDGVPAAKSPRVQLEPVAGSQFLGVEPNNRDAATDAFFSNLMLSDADAIVTFALVSKATIDPQRTYVTSAYVSTLLNNRTPALPDWFIAGFLRLYDRMIFKDNTVTVKAVRWEAVLQSSQREIVQKPEVGVSHEDTQNLNARRALELGKQPFSLPQVAPGDQFRPPEAPAEKPKATAPNPNLLLPLSGLIGGVMPDGDVGSWLELSELFVSWGLDPANGRQEGFWNWVERSSSEPATETLFQECLGIDYVAATQSLVAYGTHHRGIRWVLPEVLSRPPTYSFSDASPLQIARIKGEWERLEARYVRKNLPDLEEQYVALARRTLRKPYDRGDRDPSLIASIGLLELDAGNHQIAKDFLEEAVLGGVVRPRAHYELARMRYDYLFGRSTRNDGKYSTEQIAPILQPLLVATRQAPPLSAVYELMAHVCLTCVDPPSPEVLTALAKGTALFPRNTTLSRKIAALRNGTDDSPESLQLLEALKAKLPEPHLAR